MTKVIALIIRCYMTMPAWVVTPKVILITFGVFPITPKVLENIAEFPSDQPRMLGSKRKFSFNYLEPLEIFPIFALSFREMNDDIEESD